MEKFAGIILAAGQSERFGSPKILLDWQGDILVHFIAQKVVALGLNPVVVVTGTLFEEVRNVLRDLPVSVVQNMDYMVGIGTSLSKGIQQLDTTVDGAFLFLCDHPFIPSALIDEMKSTSTLGDVILPVFGSEIGHPVLWMSQTFARLRNIAPGETGNSIRKEFKNQEIVWKSNDIISDIDTPEDYLNLQS